MSVRLEGETSMMYRLEDLLMSIMIIILLGTLIGNASYNAIITRNVLL